jgi:hypothetical protein
LSAYLYYWLWSAGGREKNQPKGNLVRSGDGHAAVILPFQRQGIFSADNEPLSPDKIGMGRLLKRQESQKTCLSALSQKVFGGGL